MWGRLRWLVAPLVSTALLYGIFLAVTAIYFGVQLDVSGMIGGFLAELLVGYLLFSVSRKVWPFVLLQAIIIGTLLIGNAVMLDFFSVPIRPSDFSSLPTLVDQLSGWRLLLVVLPLGALVVLFVFNFRYRRISAVPVIVGVALLWALPATAPAWLSRTMDSMYHYSYWAQRDNYAERGAILYLLNEFAHEMKHAARAPSREQVVDALRRKHIKHLPARIKIAQPRNVYVVFMESFWDASLLKSAHFTADPLSPEFRALWHGDSWGMVSIFGHGSANSEFEALCGIPILDDQIAFVSKVVQKLPCLPRLLAGAGYFTAAYTQDDAGVWDHISAYKRLGFERFYANRSFVMDDLNGGNLSDVSLFRQVTDYVERDIPPRQPSLTYIETTSGHYPYHMDGSRRRVVKSSSKNPLVARYANIAFHDSRELADYISKIRARDPSAIIVAFGDHLPSFGKGGDYSASGLFPARLEQFTPWNMLTHQSTPLLVINGQSGVLHLGHIPLYEVPALVLRLLGVQNSISGALFSEPEGLKIRPALDRLLVLNGSGRPEFCDAQATPECDRAKKWLDNAKVFSADLLTGDQYAVVETTGLPTPENVDIGRPYLAAAKVGSCDIKVIHWGPRAIPVGGPRKGQAHGIWIRYKGMLSRAQIWLGSMRLHTYDGPKDLVTASLPGKVFLMVPRTEPVKLKCNNDPNIRTIGSFRIGDKN